MIRCIIPFDFSWQADWPEDGPTVEPSGFFSVDLSEVTLLKFMQQHDFEAPSDWLGYRVLPFHKRQLGLLASGELPE